MQPPLAPRSLRAWALIALAFAALADWLTTPPMGLVEYLAQFADVPSPEAQALEILRRMPPSTEQGTTMTAGPTRWDLGYQRMPEYQWQKVSATVSSAFDIELQEHPHLFDADGGRISDTPDPWLAFREQIDRRLDGGAVIKVMLAVDADRRIMAVLISEADRPIGVRPDAPRTWKVTSGVLLPIATLKQRQEALAFWRDVWLMRRLEDVGAGNGTLDPTLAPAQVVGHPNVTVKSSGGEVPG